MTQQAVFSDDFFPKPRDLPNERKCGDEEQILDSQLQEIRRMKINNQINQCFAECTKMDEKSHQIITE
jgi:hypothetical protein